MANDSSQILSDVERYYTKKILEHGPTPKGVDWNGSESQVLRFAQLCRVVDPSEPATLCDLGCGYGALYDFLRLHAPLIRYHGVDLSQEMLEAARTSVGITPGASFSLGSIPPNEFDYTVASGIFNVKGDCSELEWKEYVESTITAMNAASSHGIAFNCLTKYSDAHKMVPHLYYADPAELFDFCKVHFSRNVALLHDYQLYEFTIVVRK